MEDVYFGRTRIPDEKELAKLKGLYEYCWMLKPPKEQGTHVPYNLLVFLAKVAPKASESDYITQKLCEYGYIKDEPPKNLIERTTYAHNWIRDFEEITETTMKLNPQEIKAMEQLVRALEKTDDENEIQTAIFTIAKAHSLRPADFFHALYAILLGAPQGPRLGPYIITMGKQNVVDTLSRAIQMREN